jgi:hypothetical protein
MAPHDPEVNTIVQSALRELEEGLYRLLIKAQVAGDLSWPISAILTVGYYVPYNPSEC